VTGCRRLAVGHGWNREPLAQCGWNREPLAECHLVTRLPSLTNRMGSQKGVPDWPRGCEERPRRNASHLSFCAAAHALATAPSYSQSAFTHERERGRVGKEQQRREGERERGGKIGGRVRECAREREQQQRERQRERDSENEDESKSERERERKGGEKRERKRQKKIR